MTTKSQPMQNLLFFNYDLLQERTNSDISLEEQYVRAYIAYRAGNGLPGKSCFASVETISKDLGLSENTTRKYLKILKAAKHIIELPSRSKYGTKQYLINDVRTAWTPITNDFRNAFKNIEGIKTKKRVVKANAPTQEALEVQAFYDALNETQFLNPNSLKEFNYEEKKENSNFGTQQENNSLATEVIETPIGDGCAPVDYYAPPKPFGFAPESSEDEGSINWDDDFGIETSSDFGGSVYTPNPVIPEPEPVLYPPVMPGESLPEGFTQSSWDDDADEIFDNSVEILEPPQSQAFTQPILNQPTKPGKSCFDLTPDIEEQLTLDEKMAVENEINNVAKIAEELKPESETNEPDKRTSPLSQENKYLVTQVFGVEVLEYLDYPYMLLDFMNKKREEWRKQRAEKQAEIQQQIVQCDSDTASLSDAEYVDDWADAPIGDPDDLIFPSYIPDPEPVAMSAPPLPGDPGYEELMKSLENQEPTIGIDIANPDHIVEYLEQSNTFYNNDRRHYEIIMQEEVMDRFFPLFAEMQKDRKNPITFDKFIEFCFIYVANDMGWETERYFDGKVKSLIEPWIPSKFQSDKYSHFTKEELLNVAKRDDVEFCEKLTFQDIMLQAEKLAYEAKQANMTVEEYQKMQREEAARVANEIAAKDEKLGGLTDDIF